MPILVTCRCGKTYTFKDEAVGSHAKCSSCGHIIIVPARVTAEVVDESVDAPSKNSKALIVGFAVASVVLVAVIIVVWQVVGSAGSRTSTASATTTSGSVPAPVSTGSVPPPVKPAVFSYPPAPVKSVPVPAAAAKPADPPKLSPAELLKPWRSLTIIYGTYAASESDKDNAARKESWQAAQVKTVSEWMDWVAANPAAVPATVFLRDCPDKDRLIEAYENQTPEKKKQEVLPYNDGKVSKPMWVFWLQYQDVAFAIDELRQVVAIRIDAWPAKAPAPAKP
jgi:DNA-directed RNA polymerase subunit RPC12/RpoP